MHNNKKLNKRVMLNKTKNEVCVWTLFIKFFKNLMSHSQILEFILVKNSEFLEDISCQVVFVLMMLL